MKKVLFSVVLLFCCFAIFSGCSKGGSNATTIDPYLTAHVVNAYGTYTFSSATVVPSIVDTQTHDTTTALVITGNFAGNVSFSDKIVLVITKYRNAAGVFSIIQGQANAAYVHDAVPDFATGGVVAITNISSNSIIGYFSFTTLSGANITNGAFSVSKP